MAMTAALVTLVYALFLFDGPRKLFRDSDTGWHIRNGEMILELGQLPTVDPFSWSRSGRPWFAWEWGADALMGAAHRGSGLAGVTLLYLAAIAACTWLWFRLHWAASGDFLLACLMTPPMLSTVNMHWLARPHVFGWILLLVWIWRLERGRPTPRLTVSDGVFAALLGAAWANLHGSFFLLPLLALLYSVAFRLRPLIWATDSIQDCSRSNWYWKVALCGALGTLANPYGWQLHRHVFGYLTNAELLAQIGEFQTFNFHAEGALQILVTLALSACGALLALSQKNLARFLVLGGFTILALRSARALPIAALLLPLANGSISEALCKAGGLAARLRSRLNAALEYSSNLRLLDCGLAGYALAPLAIATAFGFLGTPALRARTGFPPDQFPVGAASVIASLPQDARILAPDKFGGYLIYRFEGSRKVFFDGRSDFYGTDFMKQYIELVQVRPGWENHLRGFGFTHALLPVNYSLVAVLPRLGWVEVYRDPTAVLLRGPGRH